MDGDDEDVGYVIMTMAIPKSLAKRTRKRESGSGSGRSFCDTDDDGTLCRRIWTSDGWGSSIALFERQQRRRGDGEVADDADSKDDVHSSSMLSGSLLSASPDSVWVALE